MRTETTRQPDSSVVATCLYLLAVAPAPALLPDFFVSRPDELFPVNPLSPVLAVIAAACYVLLCLSTVWIVSVPPAGRRRSAGIVFEWERVRYRACRKALLLTPFFNLILAVFVPINLLLRVGPSFETGGPDVVGSWWVYLLVGVAGMFGLTCYAVVRIRGLR